MVLASRGSCGSDCLSCANRYLCAAFRQLGVSEMAAALFSNAHSGLERLKRLPAAASVRRSRLARRISGRSYASHRGPALRGTRVRPFSARVREPLLRHLSASGLLSNIRNSRNIRMHQDAFFKLPQSRAAPVSKTSGAIH